MGDVIKSTKSPRTSSLVPAHSFGAISLSGTPAHAPAPAPPSFITTTLRATTAPKAFYGTSIHTHPATASPYWRGSPGTSQGHTTLKQHPAPHFQGSTCTLHSKGKLIESGSNDRCRWGAPLP